MDVLKSFNPGLGFLVFENLDEGVAAAFMNENDEMGGSLNRFGGKLYLVMDLILVLDLDLVLSLVLSSLILSLISFSVSSFHP
jgi:hypothetical protein